LDAGFGIVYAMDAAGLFVCPISAKKFSISMLICSLWGAILSDEIETPNLGTGGAAFFLFDYSLCIKLL
jgi:hypothetical protein